MDNSTDKCCRCACYGNGAIGIVVAQMLLLFGALLSSAAMGDCQLVSGTPSYWLPDNLRDYPEPYNPIDSNIDPEPNFQEQTVGFFFWELVWIVFHRRSTFECQPLLILPCFTISFRKMESAAGIYLTTICQTGGMKKFGSFTLT